MPHPAAGFWINGLACLTWSADTDRATLTFNGDDVRDWEGDEARTVVHAALGVSGSDGLYVGEPFPETGPLTPDAAE